MLRYLFWLLKKKKYVNIEKEFREVKSMNILVLNGSPKGQYSITLQTINFLMKIYPEHSFNVLHVGQRIKAFERDFSDAAESLKKADLIIFSYPVYTFIAPYQMHRFIEFVFPGIL